MNSICRDIFKAVHESKWLSIEYKSKKGEVTRYWIGIKEINPHTRTMVVEGLHLTKYKTTQLNIYIDSILSSRVMEGSYFAVRKELIRDISDNPEKYRNLFDNVANLKILEYLSECNRMDTTPFQTDYQLIEELDSDKFEEGTLMLSDEHFKHIINSFQYKAKNEQKSALHMKSLGLNCISINTKEGLYVLAYRKLYLDVQNHALQAGKNIILNKEFVLNRHSYKEGSQISTSISKYMDPAELYLLDDLEDNLELIKDRITEYSTDINGVDDMPYIIAIGRDIIVDLDKEYKGIRDMYSEDRVTLPIQAFFGDLTKKPRRTKNYPLVLLDRQINLDQLHAIGNAIKYPLTYVQGPPGTGKTKTILYTILTAFFNEKTVLFSSYNNHPIDEVCNKLSHIQYGNRTIPFPVLRIGNQAVMAQSIKDVREIYNTCQKLGVFSDTLEKKRANESKNLDAFAELMLRYEERLDLLERKAALKDVVRANSNVANLPFRMNITDRQLPEVEERLKDIGEITGKQALSLIPTDQGEMRKYLNYTAARYIKRLNEPKNADLKDIIFEEDLDTAIEEFSSYLSNDDNLHKLLRVFPVVATTCISANKLGDPKPNFDITIIDEASQCNTAMSLLPILRGNSLMMVGDPQQLNPVIVMDPADNEFLRKRYNIADEYDYISNSIYKTFLACDSVSDEIFLRSHYRCHKKIIGFNNIKYYNNKLDIQSKDNVKDPLVFIDIEKDYAGEKNTAPSEADSIIQFVKEHPDKTIGVITPFVNQKNLVTTRLKENGLGDVTCGTVHAFQGDEKDVILFSLALTNRTSTNTYNWLKNNKELINVATSRAKNQLVILSSEKELERLRQPGNDDLYELVDYVRSNGETKVSKRAVNSRALGIKPYSTETEEAFLMNLNHAMSNILYSGNKHSIHKEVPISQVFQDSLDEYNDLFYTGRFDFVVYERTGNHEYPILAIELDGKEHFSDEAVRKRDQKKMKICQDHGFELIRVENSYARRYNYIKDILSNYFAGMK